MKKEIFIILIILLSLAPNSSLISQKANYHIAYPIIDFSVGLGFMWMLQANLTISPIQNIYIQPRASLIPLLAAEYGGVVGYQTIYNNKSIIRIGLGYTEGEINSFILRDPGFTNETISSLYVRLDMLYRLKEYVVFTPNINLSTTKGKLIFSVNIALGFCLFREPNKNSSN